MWVAKLLGDDIYVYDHHTKEFHVNEGLWQDYYFDQEMCFTPIDAASARESIEARVGWFDARKNPWLHERITEAKAISTEEALGAPRVPSGAQRLARRVEDLQVAGPGVPITWALYGPEKRAAAYMAASNLRRGKVAALRENGLVVDASVVTEANGSFRVDVWNVETRVSTVR